MVFKLPRPNWSQAIVDKAGLATREFSRRIEEILGRVETQETNQDDLIADIQALQEQNSAILAQVQQNIVDIQIAQATANGAGGGGVSGSNTNTNSSVSSTVLWVPATQVSLAGVAANNLTITGSGPQQDADVIVVISNTADYIFYGQYRIVEVIGGVDGAIFGPWDFQATCFPPPSTTGAKPATVSNTDSSAVAAFSSARSSTGTVEYRIELRKVSGPNLGNLRTYLFARRA